MPRGANQRINLPSWGTFAKFMIQNLFAPKFERNERVMLVKATRLGDEGEFFVALWILGRQFYMVISQFHPYNVLSNRSIVFFLHLHEDDCST